LSGLALMALGIIGYAIQIWIQRLTTPWYMPILATLGAGFVIASLWQKRTLWRILSLLLVVLIAGLEWAFLLMVRLPAYEGPVAVGQSFPTFTTTRADGTPFTERDLAGGQNRVLVFFRGRW
jgi:hypothetical protein